MGASVSFGAANAATVNGQEYVHLVSPDTSSAVGQNSFVLGANWSDGEAPSAGKDYLVALQGGITGSSSNAPVLRCSWKRRKEVQPMFYAYILRSLTSPTQRYIGHTTNLETRLAEHNAGKCSHTSKYRPWKVEWFCAFECSQKAERFEHYLKSGSGHAFAHRHFWRHRAASVPPKILRCPPSVVIGQPFPTPI